MKYEIFDVPTHPISFCAEKASVSVLQAQNDGSLLCGLSFASPLLYRIILSKDKKKIEKFEDLKIENLCGPDLWAVTGGLRATTSGDTVLALLQKGFLPSFLSSLLGGSLEKLSGPALLEYLAKKDGGMGAYIRHSVVQIMEKELSLRRQKDPGVLLDAAHIGDFIFGLGFSAIWREPYLNTEKREVMRSDLMGNGSLHRDEDGTFWLSSKTGRIVRLGQTELKAKPTPLKLQEASLFVSAPSNTDGWLYASTSGSKELIRLRRNPVSLEEEIQKIASFEDPISGLLALEDEKTSKIVFAFQKKSGVVFKSVVTLKAEDPEALPEIPKIVDEAHVPELSCVSSLTCFAGSRDLWAGEGYLGCGQKSSVPPEKTRILRLSGL